MKKNANETTKPQRSAEVRDLAEAASRLSLEALRVARMAAEVAGKR